jgi:signal transduction histidine kinase
LLKFPRTYNRAFIYAVIFTIIVTIAAVFIYSSLSKWQNTLVEKNKLVCELYAGKLLDFSLESLRDLASRNLLENRNLTTGEIKIIDTTLKNLSKEQLKVQDGLEGGFYLLELNEFYGYSFPSSPPPVPVYGPPPRSYNIIKTQSLESIEQNQSIVNLHSFDAAVFPLATKPIWLNSKVIGVVWVRIHIQNDLPVIRLKQVVYVTAIISIAGFIILVLLSALLGGEINGIKKEMEQIRTDPTLRLRRRWWIFGYISSNINEMLDTIERDNNQRKLLERELNQKEKLASLGNMIAGVAHEVKTPLAIIKTRIQMWQLEAEKRADISDHISPESMQLVIDETNRLAGLVKKLLIFSRPIDKKMKLANLNKLINEVVGFLNIENGKIQVECNLNQDLPFVNIDENSIKQVIINILENSLEAMTNGGTININSALDKENDNIEIQISDNGQGIPDEILNKIFEPFFTSKESGVGLGLAISYQIIKAHNGEIFFENNSDRGTKCIIKLPLNQ